MNEDVSKLVALGKLDNATGERISELAPGSYCQHKSWGVGKVTSWDLIGDTLSVSFEEKPHHSMKLEFAARILAPLPANHVLSRRYFDLDALRKEALEQPEDFAASVLGDFNGSMLLDQWEKVVKGTIIPEGKFRSWWDSTKKALRKDKRFSVPSKRNLPLELRAENSSFADALLQEFKNSRAPKARLSILNDILRDPDAMKDEPDKLQELIDETNSYAKQMQLLEPIRVIELIQARDQVAALDDSVEVGEGVTIRNIIDDGRAKIEDVIKALPAARQREIYRLLPDIFGEEEWLEKALMMLQEIGPRGVGELTRFLIDEGHEAILFEHLKQGVQQRSHSSDLLAWICKERSKATSAIFGVDVGSAVLSAVEKDHYDEILSRSARLRSIIIEDKSFITDLLTNADRNAVRSFARRVKSSPVFDDLNRGSLLAKIVKMFPDVQDLISGNREDEVKDDSLIVSWQSLEKRQKALDHLRQKEIPENTREIGAARELGDLRENFEFKAAKEMQAVLLRREAEMESEISRARGTDFSGADTSVVSIGTIVTIEDTATGERETFTLLGAWDTDTDKKIISYLSGTGSSLIGNSIGSEVEIPTEDEGVLRPVRVVSIEAYFQGDESAHADAKIGGKIV